MSKHAVKRTCENRTTIAYYSGLGGLEIKHIEFGIEDYIYLVAGAWSGKRTYHRLKLHYGTKNCYVRFRGCRYKLSENCYVRFRGCRYKLSDFIRA